MVLHQLDLCNEIEMYFDRHGLNTRNANSLNVVLPKPNIEMFKQTFRYSGPKEWNSLHSDLQISQTLSSFKRLFKFNFFFSNSCLVLLLQLFIYD